MNVREDFLYFVWQFGHFNRAQLQTTDGEPVQIIRPGFRNPDAGPDYTQARIIIGGVQWVGAVEIHVSSADWDQHRHQSDAAYSQVILHVVWQYTRPVYRADGTPVPTIELQHKVDPRLISRYQYLQENASPIPCAAHFPAVADIYKRQALDQALTQRLSAKAQAIRQLLQRNQYDWEETAYQLLARNFGFKVNNEPFFRLATAVPKKVLLKHANNLTQMEALLFGQAGFLGVASEDAYVQLLQREYHFLSHKYSLSGRRLELHEWKFSQMRPASFPTLRIAQFAALLQQTPNLFSRLVEASSLPDALETFNGSVSPYWKTHYTFGKTTATTTDLGKTSKENLLINTAVPLLVGYGEESGNRSLPEKAIRWLESLSAEDNQIIRQWRELGLAVQSAFDSQAGLELYQQLCNAKKCLSCPIGVHLLRSS
jgi:hypothetical protein